MAGILNYVALHFSWHFHAAVQIWIFVLFLIDTSVTELDARLGEGELARILFSRAHRSRGHRNACGFG
jgi:hypothetical protein